MGEIVIDKPYPKQIEFFKADSKYIAYGGARGGGKSWAARTKAVLLALNYTGIQILLLRRTLAELRENHTIPLLKLLNGVARYKEQSKEFIFPNGSRIILGYCMAERDVLQYQGQSYDVIFLEEATQFTEFQFTTLTESNRSSGVCKEKFNPRMYFTCNPGGIGHMWVKRLFIDKKYQNQERPEDYTFIKSLVYENKYLMENSPDYIRTLENLPEDRRKAMLYGDWDIFEGQYFTEFNRDIHVVEPFEVPAHWRIYRTLDYGLDMLAVLWVTISPQGEMYVIKELCLPDMTISGACRAIDDITAEDIYLTYAPPDLWGRSQESGRSRIDIFSEHGLHCVKSNNDRVTGWLAIKELLKQNDDGESKLKIFSNCIELIRCLPSLQHDDKNPSDCATEPHDITHICDALRYFCVQWNYPSKEDEAPKTEQQLFKERLIRREKNSMRRRVF